MKRLLFLPFLLAAASVVFGQGKKPIPYLSFGIDYRQYPIDIEDVPRGPLPRDNGLPSSDGKFWQTLSIHGRYGLNFQKNWLVSTSLYTRYNLLHRTQGINYHSPYPTVLEPSPKNQNPKVKKNIKFDVFIDAEKKFNLKKEREVYFFAIAGVGFTNINSRFDIVITDSLDSNPFPGHHYKGTFLHFGPRLSLGYQFYKIKASIDGYIIEDPTLANLTSLWLGASLSYEIKLKKKK
jgi:hypothetical protein